MILEMFCKKFDFSTHSRKILLVKLTKNRAFQRDGANTLYSYLIKPQSFWCSIERTDWIWQLI